MKLLYFLFVCVFSINALAQIAAADCPLPRGFLDGNQKTLTIIVPRGEGGGSHQLSSKMSSILADILPPGTKIKLRHITGDDGLEAIRYFSVLPPNGYTILQHVDDVAHYLYEENLDSIRKSSIKPLAIVQRTYSQLYIRNHVEKRFKDWPGLADYASNNTVKVAVVGHEGSMEKLYIEKLNEIYGLKLQPTAFNNPSERYMAMIQDKSDLLIEQPGDVGIFLHRSLFRPVISLPAQSQAPLPGEPPLTEFKQRGMPTLERFRGFFIQSGIATERYDYLACVIKTAYNSKAFQQFNDKHKMGEKEYLSGEEAADFIDESIGFYISLGHNAAAKAAAAVTDRQAAEK